MTRLLASLVVAALVVPVAHGQGLIFPVTGDGSFQTFRVGSTEGGYSNTGAGGTVRLGKYNQDMGWMSFYGARDERNRVSLAQLLASSPGASATLYVRSKSLMPADYRAVMISLRAGNQGGLVEDGGIAAGYSQTNLPQGWTGSSQLEAFRACSPAPLTSFPTFGDGIYTLEDPNATGGIQGEPWIAPSGRLPGTGLSPFKFGGGDLIRYDKGLATTGTTATGKYIGWFPNTPSGGDRNYYALEDLLGFGQDARAATETGIANAGQILNRYPGGTPTTVSSAMYVNYEPRHGFTTGDWLAIPIDAALLADMALNAENKGFVFANNFSGLPVSYSNTDFYTKESVGGLYAPYLVIVPEPATMMLLLALGGLVLRRRR